MLKLSALKPGDIVYSVNRQRMGNTTIRQSVCHEVRIIAVDYDKMRVTYSWNGNPAQTSRDHVCRTWRRTKPVIKNPWDWNRTQHHVD